MTLRVSGLRHSYGGRTVLSGLSLELNPGEVVGLLGPNGAGKSTAMGIIAGTIRPQAGSVSLGPIVLDTMPLWMRVRAGLGYLPQEPSLLRDCTVRDNLVLAAEGCGVGIEEVNVVIERRGLGPIAGAKAGTLSGGERRRLEIARCLLGGPAVLIMDEPFSGIDPVGVGELQRDIVELKGDGMAILITDHAVDATLGVCDRAIILDEGTVMADGCPESIASDPRVRERYLGVGFAIKKTLNISLF
jgi:lipopolysaccharide export system ATP-binding protein